MVSQDPEARFLRLQKPRGAGCRLRVDRAGPDHAGQRARRRGPANPGPTPGSGTDEAYGSKANRSHLAALGVTSGLHPRLPRPGRPRKSWLARPMIERKFAEFKQFHGLSRPAIRFWPR
jgi:hypothetical protein